MSSSDPASSLARIGETAGAVWHVLAEHGPTSLAKLVKAVGEPRDTVMMALGWLAREDKIIVDENARSRTVSLR